MTHARQQIRDFYEAGLNGKTRAGDRVEATRLFDYEKTELPAINLYTLRQKTLTVTTGPDRGQHHDMTLKVEMHHSLTDDLDNDLDAFDVEVQSWIAANIPALVILELTDTDIGINLESEKPVGLLVLTYRVQFRTRMSDPETII